MRQTTRSSGAPAADDEQLLDSWKEIARYLARSVRTVQSWEKQEGLPVHRHQHRKAGTVFAYPSEIDAWREGRDELAQGGASVSERLLRRPWLTAAIAMTLVIVAGLSWQLFNAGSASRSTGSRSPLALEERDWLLIANFDNRTGEEIFDGTLEVALRRELAGFVKVAPRERVGDTLRLMRRPAETPVDAALAREVARRDGGIRAVLIGRVESDDLSFLLSVDLLNAAEGVTMASLSEVAAGPDAVLPAVNSLSLRLRESLGEALPAIDESAVSLDRVSTPSFQALRLYSLADRQLREMGARADSAAEQLLREAIAADPEFASSYTLLAWTLGRLRHPWTEILAEAEKALELADRATVVERYFIGASLDHLRWWSSKELSKADAALAQYRALLEIDPGHYWARINTWVLLNHAGRGREALGMSLRSLEARPNDVQNLSQVAHQLVVNEGDLERARSYVARARQLQQDLGTEMTPQVALLGFYPVHELWVDGDVENAVRALDRMVEPLAERPPTEGEDLAVRSVSAAIPWWLASEAAGFYLDLGMFTKAEELQTLYVLYPPSVWENIMAWHRLDKELLVEWIRQRRDSATPSEIARDARELARYGFLAEAERHLEMLPDSLPARAEADVLAATGVLDLAAGRYGDAISSLERSIALGGDSIWSLPDYFRNVRTLSRAWVGQGDPDRGVRVLEEASRLKPRVLSGRASWMQVQLQLAELYRELGRQSEARQIENELRRYCAWADPDFPILQELQKRGT